MKKRLLILFVLFSLAINSQEENKNISFTLIEEAPVFPSCESYNTNVGRKKCTNTGLKKHAQEKFNASLIGCLEEETIVNSKTGKRELICSARLATGRKIIIIQFVINKKGIVENINVDAPHPKLRKEGMRIAKLIPKMIPGKQKGIPVNVAYSLPISFIVK